MDEFLDRVFRKARTFGAWQTRPVSVETLRAVYDLARMGPTSMNSGPGRFVFLTSPESKERLVPALSPGNVQKTREAGAVAIVAWDNEFYRQLPKLAPHMQNAQSIFEGKSELIRETAFRNSSLQAGYFILAARAMGLDCGPMSGFNAEKVNAEFFPDGQWSVNLLCNLGYGDPAKLHPRSPRLEFEDACRIL